VEPFWIGSFRVEPHKNVIERKDYRVRVEPKAMRVLVFLAERAGEDVGREEILRAIWDGSPVKADVLTNAIWELRKAFGDDPREPEFIQTVSKKGYRLVARVERNGRRRLPNWLRSWIGAVKGSGTLSGES
jgi:DNA-binding winged helix-turn-helix (wHTH) protein